MRFDVFISHAWTSDEYREWARLLAASLRHVGFSVVMVPFALMLTITRQLVCVWLESRGSLWGGEHSFIYTQ